MEEWKPVGGYEGIAEVSNLGRVRTLDRVLFVKRGEKLFERKLKGRVLKGSRYSNGYIGVKFSLNGRGHLVHRLVGFAFVSNDSPATKTQINHKNGDRLDNRAENLEWVTCSENHKHSYRHLSRKQHALQETVKMEKDGEVLFFESCLSASKSFGVSPGSIASAATRNHKCKGWVVTYETR